VNYVYFDFETSSIVNLKSCGVQHYVNHPSTKIISMAFAVGDTVTAIRGDKLPSGIVALCNTHTFVSHNGELFDELLWRRFYATVPEFEDTLHLARLAGYPGKLAELYKLICGVEKGDDTAMRILCAAKPGPTGKFIYPVGTKALWDKLLEYNAQDVRYLKQIHETLRVHLTQTEERVIRAHREINKRGFLIDTDYVHDMRQEWTRVQNDAKDEIASDANRDIHGNHIPVPV